MQVTGRVTGFSRSAGHRLTFAPPAVYYHLNFSLSLCVFFFFGFFFVFLRHAAAGARVYRKKNPVRFIA